MSCAGCNLIETECVTMDSQTRCKLCPDIDARIIQAFDLDGRRAALERIEAQRGKQAADAVRSILLEMWRERA